MFSDGQAITAEDIRPQLQQTDAPELGKAMPATASADIDEQALEGNFKHVAD